MIRIQPSGKHVLITGGAGFIGSHLADELLRAGHRVRVLDCLAPQVHGPAGRRPDYLDPDVELLVGDVRDADDVRRALRGVDAVVHLAAAVGVGQSMYQLAHYTSVNALGTAVLLEALIERPVERLIVASSMSIYGEGLYEDEDGRLQPGASRRAEQLRRADWEVRDARGRLLRPRPTPETKTPSLESIYALTKYDQERQCLTIGRAYGIPTVALRLFNVYGTRQALSNPYTGVLAIFLSRLQNGKPPLIYEDGRQQRDFVSVHDVARAFRLAMEARDVTEGVYNIGGGRAYSVEEIARRAADATGQPDVEPRVTGRYRAGDIRNCYADVSRAARDLGYRPQMELDAGLAELADWLAGQVAVDRSDHADAELSSRGLTA